MGGPLDASRLKPFSIGRISIENRPNALATIRRLLMRLPSLRPRRANTGFKLAVVLVYHDAKTFLTHLPFLLRLGNSFTTVYEAFRDLARQHA